MLAATTTGSQDRCQPNSSQKNKHQQATGLALQEIPGACDINAAIGRL